MTPTITHQQEIIEQIQNLTPEQQDKVLEFIEFLQYKIRKSETKSIVVEQPEKPMSFAEAAKEFIGCVEGGPGDLSSNKDYLRRIGKK